MPSRKKRQRGEKRGLSKDYKDGASSDINVIAAEDNGEEINTNTNTSPIIRTQSSIDVSRPADEDNTTCHDNSSTVLNERGSIDNADCESTDNTRGSNSSNSLNVNTTSTSVNENNTGVVQMATALNNLSDSILGLTHTFIDKMSNMETVMMGMQDTLNVIVIKLTPTANVIDNTNNHSKPHAQRIRM